MQKSIWDQSVLIEKLAQQRVITENTPRGLATDIDRTFWLQEVEPSEYYLRKTQEIVDFTNERKYPRIAVTSRDFPMMQVKPVVGVFDVLLLSLGSERYVKRNGTYELDSTYQRYIEEELGFKRESVYPACLEFLESARRTYANSRIELQPRDRPGSSQAPQPYKISFSFFGSSATSAALQKLLRTLLDTSGLTNVQAIFSVDSHQGNQVRHNIDVVPIDKGTALQKTIGEIETLAGEVRWLYAGDSMNDYSALINAGTAAIVVGGESKDLRAVLSKMHRKTHDEHTSFYIENPFSTNRPRLIYEERDPRLKGPASLIKALRYFESAS